MNEMVEYKVKQLAKMLEAENKSDGGYGAHLTHWAGTAKPINIDAGALRVLIHYYSGRMDLACPEDIKNEGTA